MNSRNRIRLAAAAGAGVLSVAIGGSALAGNKTLDVVKLKAEPANIKTKIAAVAKKNGSVYVAISTKKGRGGYKQRDKAAAGVNASAGRVSIEAGQEGESYSKNGGEGLLSVGEDYNEYFGWNAKRGNIRFYGD